MRDQPPTFSIAGGGIPGGRRRGRGRAAALLLAALQLAAVGALPMAAGAPPSELSKPHGAERVETLTHRLGEGDTVTVVVPEAEEFSSEAMRIGADGTIRLPRLGRERAAGRTTAELEAALGQRLRAFVKEPGVIVSIAELGSRPVSVIGAVRDPGVYQIRGDKRLIEVLSAAGGPAETAGNRIKLVRRREWGLIPAPGAAFDSSGSFSVAEIRLDEVIHARDPRRNLLLRPHDVVSIPRAAMIYVVGAVRQAGAFPLRERESLSILQALAMAGGLDAAASKKGAKILRAEPGASGVESELSERREIAVDLRRVIEGKAADQPLAGDDIVFVPHSSGKTVGARALQTMVNTVSGIAVWRVGNGN